jgi:hypothetical protein
MSDQIPAFETLSVTLEGAVAIVRLNRPGQAECDESCHVE